MKVFVDTMFGSTFSFDLDPHNMVFDIKRSFENSQGIPVSMQTLYFNGLELLVDHYQLRVYCIVNNSRLLLWLRDDQVNNQMQHQSPYAIQGFVPSIGRSNYDQVPPSHVSNDGLFPEMPQDISLKQGFLPETAFGDNFKIQESLRRNKKNQDLVQREPSLPSYTFGDWSLGEDFTDILSHWPASATEAIANENQVFQTEHSIVQSNSTEESSSQVMFQTEKSPQPQKLMLTMTQYDKPGRKFLLEVNAADNVEELKRDLEYQFNLPAEGYFLLHNERVLDDDKSFNMNRVANGDTIEIFPGPVIEDRHT
ncbi:hypothetical protein N665_0869s0002 [Sinapis alba]|nr:hypothetical protein N665_0869s0002 [Sinapis alba]